MKESSPRRMRVIPEGPRDPVLARAAALVAAEIGRRTAEPVRAVEYAPPGPDDIVLTVAPELGAEAYRIDSAPEQPLRVTGGDARGVLYGSGRLLRSGLYSRQRVVFDPPAGLHRPALPWRGIYFATHFGNFYHHGPVEQAVRYVEELALWGINHLIVWFDMHHFTGLDDPAGRAHLERLRRLHEAARGVGMKVGLGVLANEAYAGSPEPLRADPRTGRAHYKVEVCPSRPEGLALIRRQFQELFDQFDRVDFIWVWPYDQGGCACAKCRPWGANGFLRAGREVAEVFRRRWPDGQVILSTWLFDYQQDEGEWRGLYAALDQGLDWVDAVLADGHNAFPRWPLDHPLPHGLPLVNFPEISMQDMYPWGGFGANPRPQHWQEMWDLVGSHLAGGFPYSEGIFEDVNKVIWAQLYWDGRRPVRDILREYAAWEFSPDLADDIAQALERLETTLGHSKSTFRRLAGASAIWEIVRTADGRLPAWARTGWRWRLVYLRARIDAELESSGGRPTPAVRAALEELTTIYHAHQADPPVRPPALP